MRLLCIPSGTGFPKAVAVAAFLTLPSLAEDAANVEARLKETSESSPLAAELMLGLIDHYWGDEQVFGLIRTAAKFSRAQADHPRRAEVMAKLIAGHAATARHDDVITTARQFFELFPAHDLTSEVRDRLATAFERTGQAKRAAEQCGLIWRESGNVEQGIRAIRLWNLTDDPKSYREITDLAARMVETLPNDSRLTAVAFQGLEAARRTELWAEGLQIANTFSRRQSKLDEDSRRDLEFREGLFESRLGQHGNAVDSFRQSLGPGRHEAHRNLVDAMIQARATTAQVEAEARRYLAVFPQREDRYEPLARTAHAAAEAGDLARARSIALDVIAHDVERGDLPRAFVRWCGDDVRHAERGLVDAISRNPRGGSKLRAVLVIDVYRDRLKDLGKARSMAREFLQESPSSGGWTEEIVKFLLDSAPSDEAYRDDLNRITDSARAHAHLGEVEKRLWSPSPADHERSRLWRDAKRDYLNQPETRLWSQTRENGGKAAQACKQLLQTKLPTYRRNHLLARLAYVYRHHLGGKSREVSGEFFQNLCKALPDDLPAAADWLEAAGHGNPAMRLTAARHLLSLPPANTHPDTWIRLIETRDEQIIRKALPWIEASAAKGDHPLSYSARIGDILHELGMKTEAVTWWKSRMDIDPADGEAVECALRAARTLKADAAIAFLTPRFEADSPGQGAYAGEIANFHFKAGDFNAMSQVLTTSRNRALAHPFQNWSLGEWPPRGWFEAGRNTRDWPREKQIRLFTIIRDLQLQRVSPEAGMELIHSAPRSLDRLLDAQHLLLLADRHYESWNRLFPCAQAALARDQPTLAAVILNGLLNSVGSVGEKETAQARKLLRQAYGKMGSFSADIPADSPIAPLLQVLLHLRLGESEAAEETYYKNRSIFDSHRNELPVELILFAAECHISQGTPDDHERAEDILRGWIVQHGEINTVDARDKARVQILLARNYQRASQYDIARAEFTTVLNLYKDQPQALEARFGIGETFMAQKVHDQAEEIFVDLAENPDPAIAMRANFLRGVLALRMEANEEARKIFLSVLESAPDVHLANEILYHLAEVYGIEQRFLSQLETLRAVGRLGQESKLWQTPGIALPIIVQDPDLGISRGDTRIPVVLRTEPGNDEEHSFLSSGGAGKGIFLTEIPTTLGEATPGNGTLEVTGGDVITVDYPEDFKNQFQFEFLSNTRLRIASDGHLDVAGAEIRSDESPSFTERLKEEVDNNEEPPVRAEARPVNQIKPGNLVYIQVRDGDRDQTAEPDEVAVQLHASSGDEVRLKIAEESAHGGVFTGTVRTGELPAGAKASDSAIDHGPLLAIDHDETTAWRSEPDGIAPKSITIDMKELRPVETIELSSPDPEYEAPSRMRVRGSHDGRFWFGLAEFPPPPAAPPLAIKDAPMQLRVYRTPADQIRDHYKWEQIAELVAKVEPTEIREVESLSWEAPAETSDAAILIWSGPLVQERDGAMRLEVSGSATAIMLDGRLELPPGKGGRTVDVFARRGIHHLTVVSIATPEDKLVEVRRGRGNPASSAVSMHPFKSSDCDPKTTPGLEKVAPAPPPRILRSDNHWTLELPAQTLRYVDFEFLEYRGEAVAVSNVTISGDGSRHIPPAEDVLELAHNEILELAPGDTVQVSYLDEITAGGEARNRPLSKSLTATYCNGRITPIGYDFGRGGGGSVSGTRKELLRIEPGERIVAEVVDFDLDVNRSRDTVQVEVQVNADPPLPFTATETGPSTGIFIAEIETSSEPANGKLLVSQGDKIHLRYRDTQNTFPGHAVLREALVLLNEPTNGMVHIVESETPAGSSPRLVPTIGGHPDGHVAKVEFSLPLTVEVIDPDRAKDSRSTVTVEVETTRNRKIRVECVLSRAFAAPDESLAESGNSALFEGRFTGQVPMVLGGPGSPESIPADGNFDRSWIGRVLPRLDDSPEASPDDGGAPPAGELPVLNVMGDDTLTARYHDQSRPGSEPMQLSSSATLASAASLAITDDEYLENTECLHVGQKLYLLLSDPDRDLTDERDKALVRIMTNSGEDETIELEETLSHSAVFSGSFPLAAVEKPTAGNFSGTIECFFGDEITVGYLDNVPQTPDGLSIIERRIPVALGTDGEMMVFSKAFKDEDLAVQTRFHIAESHFELFKGHRKLGDDEQSAADLEAGRRVLRELQEDHPNPKHAPRVAYLLGQFAQEMKAWDQAIAAYRSIVQNHPEHNLAPDSQYKLGQCHEEAGELDAALEAYVTLAGTYPKSPLIANVMLRISEHFYAKEDYSVAASVGEKFIERFANHEWTPKMSFRIGQCHYKLEDYHEAGPAFDAFVKRFPEQELTAQALFWAGESYRMAKDLPNAFRRYNRCRWDFPESDAAKYSRGRLALPELLEQFEREANLNK